METENGMTPAPASELIELPPDLAEEFRAWEAAGDEAWSMIDEWESNN